MPKKYKVWVEVEEIDEANDIYEDVDLDIPSSGTFATLEEAEKFARDLYDLGENIVSGSNRSEGTAPTGATFQLTLIGYNPELRGTDHLVKWVKAPNLEALNRWIDLYDIRKLLQKQPELLGDHADNYTPDDGVDVVVGGYGDNTSTIKEWQQHVQEVQ